MNNYKKFDVPKRELSSEDKFELMIKVWKKESDDRLKDLKRGSSRKLPDKRYKLSPYRCEGSR